MLSKRIRNLFPSLAIFLSTFFIYIHNLSSSVYGGDSGDFLSAIAVHGVAHPSGYPLYTILGILFSWLPVNATLAWKVGLVSALFSALAVVIFYKIVIELTKNKILATISSLTLAFTFPFWLFAEVSEVFALHNFFLLALFYIALLIYRRKQIKYLYLLFLFLGLSFSNHALTLFIIPSLIIFIYFARKMLKVTLSIAIKCFGLFLLGLLPYLYIFIAASHNPPINWDHASNLSNFIHLVTRADYGWSGVRGEVNVSMRLISLQQYFSYITYTHLNIIILALSMFGLIGILQKKQYISFFAIILSFILFGPLFSFYSGTLNLDIFGSGISEKFYTSSIIFLIILMPYGITYIVDFINRLVSNKDNPASKKFIYSTFAIIPILFLTTNFSNTDLHSLWIGDKFGKDILTPLPKNSKVTIDPSENVILGSIDDANFNSKYMQYAYGIRKDVAIINAEDSLDKSIKENDSAFVVVKDFNGLKDIDKSRDVPYGLLFLKSADSKDIFQEEYLKTQNSILNSYTATAIPQLSELSQLKLVADIPLWYARAYANTGAYIIYKYKDYETAKDYFRKALVIDPNNAVAYEGLGDYSFYKHDCKSAEVSYEKATETDFLNKRYYQKLYTVVNSCLQDKEKAQELRTFFSNYPSLFGGIH